MPRWTLAWCHVRRHPEDTASRGAGSRPAACPCGGTGRPHRLWSPRGPEAQDQKRPGEVALISPGPRTVSVAPWPGGPLVVWPPRRSQHPRPVALHKRPPGPRRFSRSLRAGQAEHRDEGRRRRSRKGLWASLDECRPCCPAQCRALSPRKPRVVASPPSPSTPLEWGPSTGL